MGTKVLSIDIQADRISVALLESRGAGIRLIESEEQILDTSLVSLPDTLADLLPETLLKIDRTFSRCVVSLPPGIFSYRTLTLPFSNKRKIDQILANELESQLPWPAENLVFDYHIIECSRSRADSDTRVRVSCLRSEVLERYLSILNDCAIDPDVVIPGSGRAVALQTAANLLDSQNVSGCFILFCQVSDLTLYYVDKESIFYNRTIPVKSSGSSDILLQAVKHSLIFCSESYELGGDMPSLVLCGDSNEITRWQPMLKDVLPNRVIQYELFDDERGFVDLGDSAARFSSGMKSAVAAGMAELKHGCDLNFIKKVSDFTVFYQENRGNLIATVTLILCLAFVFGVSQWQQVSRLKKNIRHLDMRITELFKETFPGVHNIVDPVRQMNIHLNQLKKDSSFSNLRKSALNVDLLNAISKKTAIPDGY